MVRVRPRIAVVVLAVALAVGVGAWFALRDRGEQFSGPPRAQFPIQLDLGERAANETVVQPFFISNRGGEELVIDQVGSSCSCGVLGRTVGDRMEPIERLTVPPGGRVEVVVRLDTRVASAGNFAQTVTFRTNDPNRPEGRVTLTFKAFGASVRALPNSLPFSRVVVGTSVKQVVEVYDDDPRPQTVARVTSPDPERVTVNWLPAKPGERTDSGALLGRIEVVPAAVPARGLTGDVVVTFADERVRPLVVPISGSVVRRVEALPAALVLPRNTGAGPEFTGTCLVRDAEGRAPELELVSAPPDLRAEVGPGTVRVTWTPGAGTGTVRHTVRLRARTGGETETVDIPVTCEHPN